MRGEAEGTDRGDERGTQKSQGAACGHRPADQADKNAAQVVGLYAPPPGGHGVLDHRQTNRTGTEYGPLKDRTEYTTGESIDIIDEVSEMGVEMFDNVLKNVKRKTRPSRVEKVFDIGSFHWEDSYSNSKSWKNKKRQKQWMRKECRERIRHPEYRYTDILLPDDLCETMSTF